MAVSKTSLILSELLGSDITHVILVLANWRNGSSTGMLDCRGLHKVFNSLFATLSHRLELVEWGIHNSTIHTLELSELLKINFDILTRS